MKYEFKKNQLLSDGAVVYTTPSPIEEIVQGGDKVFIRFNPEDEHDENLFFDSNVCCGDGSGVLLWKIQPFNLVPRHGCYTGLFFSNGELRAYAFEGFNCLIDQETGKI